MAIVRAKVRFPPEGLQCSRKVFSCARCFTWNMRNSHVTVHRNAAGTVRMFHVEQFRPTKEIRRAGPFDLSQESGLRCSISNRQTVKSPPHPLRQAKGPLFPTDLAL